MENPNFLKKKYDLHKSPEVESSARRTEARTGKKLAQNPETRIQNYLDRLERLVLDPEKKQKRKELGQEQRPRALSLLREMIMNEYVRPHKAKLAENAARVEERAARNMGIEAQYGEEELEQRGEMAVEDLEKSLDEWIAYLSDSNEAYPMWFRYYVFRNILGLGDYDKDKKQFTKRSRGSMRLFPEIDRGALAYVQQMIEAAKDPQTLKELQKAQKALANGDIPESELITAEKAKRFADLPFAKQYAEGLAQAGEITPEMRKETRGEWVKYQKGTDPTALWASLQNKGTAWCTKGFATAKAQLQGGDFYVYYTLDKKGQPTIPRIAIRMQDDNVFEVRGVADSAQNLEENMLEIAEKKLDELPGAEKYRKASGDMKRITEIEKRVKEGEEPTKDDLAFLYEIDSPIQGFGYKKDPRIKELLSGRSIRKDLALVFGCSEDEISLSKEEALKGGIKYHRGNLDLDGFTSAEGLNLPDRIGGNLDLGDLTSAEGLNFPDRIDGGIYLNSLTSAEGLNLPDRIDGILYLHSLTSAEGLNLPDRIGGSLYFNNLAPEEKRKLQGKYPHLKIR